MIPDDVWQVIVDHYKKYDNVTYDAEAKKAVEHQAKVVNFDGGVFIVVENEFDVFVSQARQGKWNVKHEITKVIDSIAKDYPTAIIQIQKDNAKSLRLAKHFKFNEVSRDDGLIRLEKRLWVE
jgi:hypothetical protein